MTIPKKQIIVLCLSLILVFGVAAPVHAQEIVYGDTVREGETVEGDIFLTGDTVVIAGRVNGNVFVFGNVVELRETGMIDGSLVVVGWDVFLDGPVTGGVYGAAIQFSLEANCTLERDLYVASGLLNTEAEAEIDRDLYAVALGGEFYGTIGRDPHAIVGEIAIFNYIVETFDINIPPLREWGDYFKQNDTPAVDEPVSSLVAERARVNWHALVVEKEINRFDWGKWALKTLRNWVSLFVMGLLALWLWQKPLEKSGKHLERKPLTLFLNALLILILMPGAFLLILVIAALFFAIGVGLGSIGLWGLALVFWTIAYAGISVLAIAFLALIVYGGVIIVVYRASDWVFKKLIPEAAKYRVLVLLAGTVVYALLSSTASLNFWISWIGGLFIFVVSMTGLSAAWLAFREYQTSLAKAPDSEVPALPKKASKSARANS